MDYYENYDFKDYLSKVLNQRGEELNIRLFEPFRRHGHEYTLCLWDEDCEEPVLAYVSNEDGEFRRLPVAVLDNKECRQLLAILIKEAMKDTARELICLPGDGLSEMERKSLLNLIRDLADIH